MYVRLQDVSRVDASASVVAEQVMRDVQAGGAVRLLNFAIHGNQLAPRTHYVVRVHVDVDNDGEVSAGDYVSTASHPITLNSVPTTLSIPVYRV